MRPVPSIAPGGSSQQRAAGAPADRSTQQRAAGAPADRSPQARAVAFVAAQAEGPPMDPIWRVTLHFHPGRLVDGLPILDAMAGDGRYRSQFETKVSNGGLTAHPGGDRWRWESRMFGGAYDDADPAERPTYGSLNFRRRAVGGSPRFGSAYLRLRPETAARTTFCYPDSVLEPTDFGVSDHLSLAALAAADARDPLDDYIEAHVHGPVRFDCDVEALVLDPCFAGTGVAAAAARLGCPVEWHTGFRLTVDELRGHPDYRGPEFVALGMALARDGHLDPGVIDRAACTGRYDEQALKRVWHCLARFGSAYEG